MTCPAFPVPTTPSTRTTTGCRRGHTRPAAWKRRVSTRDQRGERDTPTAKSKKAKRGRRENPEYQETIRIDAPPEAVARSIVKRPLKAESEWHYLKGK